MRNRVKQKTPKKSSLGKSPKGKLRRKKQRKSNRMKTKSPKVAVAPPSPLHIEVIDLEEEDSLSIDEVINLDSSGFCVDSLKDVSMKSNEELFVVDHCDGMNVEETAILEPIYKKDKWEHIPKHLRSPKNDEAAERSDNSDDGKKRFSQLKNIWDALPSSSNNTKMKMDDDCIVLDDSEDDEVVDLVSDNECDTGKPKKKRKSKMGVCSGVLSSDRKNKENKSTDPSPPPDPAKLRPVVIDGCNVAFGHGKDKFSSRGLKICVEYFKKRGHKVKIFVPQFRRRHFTTVDSHILDELEKEGTLCYTPSRSVEGKLLVSYDDRFIVEYAANNGGIIVTRDNYRDLLKENPEWTETINQRLLLYTWVDDTIMFPHDPLGRHGPSLKDFLSF